MSSITYGYARVSTQVQKEGRQPIALRDFGVPEENIVVEKQSGKNFARPLYRGLIEMLRPGDVLVVQSIDRLGRNYTEILDQWRMITKEQKAAIVVLDMPLLDTREGRDLTGTLIAGISRVCPAVAKWRHLVQKRCQRAGGFLSDVPAPGKGISVCPVRTCIHRRGRCIICS